MSFIKSEKKKKKGIDKSRMVWYIDQAVASGRAPALAKIKSFEKNEKTLDKTMRI